MKIRDGLRRLRDDGWYIARQERSHRGLKHPVKNGIIVLAGHPSEEMKIGTLRGVWKQADLE